MSTIGSAVIGAVLVTFLLLGTAYVGLVLAFHMTRNEELPHED